MNTSKNPDFPCRQYRPFDLDSLSDDAMQGWFRFLNETNIYIMKDLLQIYDEIVCNKPVSQSRAVRTSGLFGGPRPVNTAECMNEGRYLRYIIIDIFLSYF